MGLLLLRCATALHHQVKGDFVVRGKAMDHVSWHDKRWYWFQMNAWKFDTDRLSTAEVLAFTDDDSCMQVVPGL